MTILFIEAKDRAHIAGKYEQWKQQSISIEGVKSAEWKQLA